MLTLNVNKLQPHTKEDSNIKQRTARNLLASVPWGRKWHITVLAYITIKYPRNFITYGSDSPP
jgi:hypothetical protein